MLGKISPLNDCDHGCLHHNFVRLKELACSMPDLE